MSQFIVARTKEDILENLRQEFEGLFYQRKAGRDVAGYNKHISFCELLGRDGFFEIVPVCLYIKILAYILGICKYD